MAAFAHDEHTRVWWVPTLGSVTAPLKTEIDAGVELTTYVSKDGVKVGSTNNVVKNDTIATAFAGELPGTFGNKVSVKCFRDAASDVPWNTLGTRGTQGNLVVRRGPLFTAVTAVGQKVEVYPVYTQQPIIEDTAENTRAMVQYDLAVWQTPALQATIS